MLLDIKRLRQTKDMNLWQSKGIDIIGNCEQQGRYKTQKKYKFLNLIFKVAITYQHFTAS
jgi:hypothetical protein